MEKRQGRAYTHTCSRNTNAHVQLTRNAPPPPFAWGVCHTGRPWRPSSLQELPSPRDDPPRAQRRLWCNPSCHICHHQAGWLAGQPAVCNSPLLSRASARHCHTRARDQGITGSTLRRRASRRRGQATKPQGSRVSRVSSVVHVGGRRGARWEDGQESRASPRGQRTAVHPPPPFPLLPSTLRSMTEVATSSRGVLDDSMASLGLLSLLVVFPRCALISNITVLPPPPRQSRNRARLARPTPYPPAQVYS